MKMFYCFMLLAYLIACKEKSNDMELYETLKKKELANGRREDSIFFNMYLGMPTKDFYTHCWEQNKKGIFKDGMGNAAVAYKLDSNELEHQATMFFYPDFVDGKISQMKTTFQYDGWAPWNKFLSADTLLLKVFNLYKKWYPAGNDFITIQDKKKGTIYVKVDGNRQIIIGIASETNVQVVYTDLFLEDKNKKKLK